MRGASSEPPMAKTRRGSPAFKAWLRMLVTSTLKLARSMVALRKTTEACRTLDELSKRYPKAPPQIVSRAASTRVAAKCG